MIGNRLDINPGDGIGPIQKGMRPAEVCAVFDEPEVYDRWMGGNLNDALLFHGLCLHFGECDSHAPLPHSTLDLVRIHQREDAFLFNRPMAEWTKDAILEELRARGYAAESYPNGAVVVLGKLELAFGDDGRLTWVEI